MAIKVPPAPDILTYEQYMAEEEICLRYDIIEGVRIYMPGPTWRHQRIADKITRNLPNATREGPPRSAHNPPSSPI
ncbi:MAG TPA: hypothetical protein VFB21_01235 [Chthonomonadaceae bacterium]|nr:hypothetical protein [Chthonomonadaceae bacterium]